MTANQHILKKAYSHIFTNYHFTLQNGLFVAVAKRKLREHCRTAIAKFQVLPGELSFVLTNVLELNETLKKFPPLYQ